MSEEKIQISEEKICRWCKKPITDQVWAVEHLHNYQMDRPEQTYYYHFMCYSERTRDNKTHAFDFNTEYRGSKQKCPDCDHDEFKVMVVHGWNGTRTWLTCTKCGRRFYVEPSMNCPAHETDCPSQRRWDE